jgi:hypothetical protein
LDEKGAEENGMSWIWKVFKMVCFFYSFDLSQLYLWLKQRVTKRNISLNYYHLSVPLFDLDDLILSSKEL